MRGIRSLPPKESRLRTAIPCGRRSRAVRTVHRRRKSLPRPAPGRSGSGSCLFSSCGRILRYPLRWCPRYSAGAFSRRRTESRRDIFSPLPAADTACAVCAVRERKTFRHGKSRANAVCRKCLPPQAGNRPSARRGGSLPRAAGRPRAGTSPDTRCRT